MCDSLGRRNVLKQQRVKTNTQQSGAFTSCAVVCQRFEQVKGRRGPVLHREELANPAGCWRADASHLAVQDRLQMAALTPQQGGDVPGEKKCSELAPPSGPHRTSMLTLFKQSRHTVKRGNGSVQSDSGHMTSSSHAANSCCVVGSSATWEITVTVLVLIKPHRLMQLPAC